MAILKGFPPSNTISTGYYRPPELKIKVQVRDPICRKAGEAEDKEFAHLRNKPLVTGNAKK